MRQKPVKDETMSEWLSPVPEVEVGSPGTEGPLVRARKDIQRGARFGPFLGKWASRPDNPRYAWEVSQVYQTKIIITYGGKISLFFIRLKFFNIT